MHRRRCRKSLQVRIKGNKRDPELRKLQSDKINIPTINYILNKMKQNAKIIINCTTEEKEKIKKLADQVPTTLGKFSLKVLLSSEIESKIKANYPENR